MVFGSNVGRGFGAGASRQQQQPEQQQQQPGGAAPSHLPVAAAGAAGAAAPAATPLRGSPTFPRGTFAASLQGIGGAPTRNKPAAASGFGFGGGSSSSSFGQIAASAAPGGFGAPSVAKTPRNEASAARGDNLSSVSVTGSGSGFGGSGFGAGPGGNGTGSTFGIGGGGGGTSSIGGSSSTFGTGGSGFGGDASGFGRGGGGGGGAGTFGNAASGGTTTVRAGHNASTTFRAGSGTSSAFGSGSSGGGGGASTFAAGPSGGASTFAAGPSGGTSTFGTGGGGGASGFGGSGGASTSGASSGGSGSVSTFRGGGSGGSSSGTGMFGASTGGGGGSGGSSAGTFGTGGGGGTASTYGAGGGAAAGSAFGSGTASRAFNGGAAPRAFDGSPAAQGFGAFGGGQVAPIFGAKPLFDTSSSTAGKAAGAVATSAPRGALPRGDAGGGASAASGANAFGGSGGGAAGLSVPGGMMGPPPSRAPRGIASRLDHQQPQGQPPIRQQQQQQQQQQAQGQQGNVPPQVGLQPQQHQATPARLRQQQVRQQEPGQEQQQQPSQQDGREQRRLRASPLRRQSPPATQRQDQRQQRQQQPADAETGEEKQRRLQRSQRFQSALPYAAAAVAAADDDVDGSLAGSGGGGDLGGSSSGGGDGGGGGDGDTGNDGGGNDAKPPVKFQPKIGRCELPCNDKDFNLRSMGARGGDFHYLEYKWFRIMPDGSRELVPNVIPAGTHMEPAELLALEGEKDRERAIKKHQRSAAGTGAEAEELRTPAALQRSMALLLEMADSALNEGGGPPTDIGALRFLEKNKDKAKALADQLGVTVKEALKILLISNVYAFLWDRARQIPGDLTSTGYPPKAPQGIITMMETSVRLLAFGQVRQMADPEYKRLGFYGNQYPTTMEQLSKLIELYAAVRREIAAAAAGFGDGGGGVDNRLANEAEFRSYCLLLYRPLDIQYELRKITCDAPHLLRTEWMKRSLRICSAVKGRRWDLFFKEMRKAPYITRCCMLHLLLFVRITAVGRMRDGCAKAALKEEWPEARLRELLYIENDDILRKHAEWVHNPQLRLPNDGPPEEYLRIVEAPAAGLSTSQRATTPGGSGAASGARPPAPAALGPVLPAANAFAPAAAPVPALAAAAPISASTAAVLAPLAAAATPAASAMQQLPFGSLPPQGAAAAGGLFAPWPAATAPNAASAPAAAVGLNARPGAALALAPAVGSVPAVPAAIVPAPATPAPASPEELKRCALAEETERIRLLEEQKQHRQRQRQRQLEIEAEARRQQQLQAEARRQKEAAAAAAAAAAEAAAAEAAAARRREEEAKVAAAAAAEQAIREREERVKLAEVLGKHAIVRRSLMSWLDWVRFKQHCRRCSDAAIMDIDIADADSGAAWKRWLRSRPQQWLPAAAASPPPPPPQPQRLLLPAPLALRELLWKPLAVKALRQESLEDVEARSGAGVASTVAVPPSTFYKLVLATCEASGNDSDISKYLAGCLTGPGADASAGSGGGSDGGNSGGSSGSAGNYGSNGSDGTWKSRLLQCSRDARLALCVRQLTSNVAGGGFGGGLAASGAANGADGVIFALGPPLRPSRGGRGVLDWAAAREELRALREACCNGGGDGRGSRSACDGFAPPLLVVVPSMTEVGDGNIASGSNGSGSGYVARYGEQHTRPMLPGDAADALELADLWPGDHHVLLQPPGELDDTLRGELAYLLPGLASYAPRRPPLVNRALPEFLLEFAGRAMIKEVPKDAAGPPSCVSAVNSALRTVAHELLGAEQQDVHMPAPEFEEHGVLRGGAWYNLEELDDDEESEQGPSANVFAGWNATPALEAAREKILAAQLPEPTGRGAPAVIEDPDDAWEVAALLARALCEAGMPAPPPEVEARVRSLCFGSDATRVSGRAWQGIFGTLLASWVEHKVGRDAAITFALTPRAARELRYSAWEPPEEPAAAALALPAAAPPTRPPVQAAQTPAAAAKAVGVAVASAVRDSLLAAAGFIKAPTWRQARRAAIEKPSPGRKRRWSDLSPEEEEERAAAEASRTLKWLQAPPLLTEQQQRQQRRQKFRDDPLLYARAVAFGPRGLHLPLGATHASAGDSGGVGGGAGHAAAASAAAAAADESRDGGSSGGGGGGGGGSGGGSGSGGDYPESGFGRDPLMDPTYLQETARFNAVMAAAQRELHECEKERLERRSMGYLY